MATRGATVSNNNDALIEIRDVKNKQLASSIQRKLFRESPLSPKCCIFRVPTILRRHNKSAYEPHIISIGPFHHGKKALKAMEKIKLWYLHDLISRARTPNTSLEGFIKEISELEKSARDCFAEPINLEGDKFVEMMVVDGCFIIELFRKHNSQTVLVDKNDPTFNMPWVQLALQNDLLLLENQLPWCVLECLFNLTTTVHHQQGTPSLANLALKFFHYMMLMTVTAKPNSRFETKHLLDLVRSSLLSPIADTEADYTGWEVIPSVTDLLQSGVRFKTGNPENILNVKFKKGVLEIPSIILQENAETIFRNLIAFEQCDHERTNRITSFAILLDNLINTSKDVDFLSQKGIIVNFLSSEDISLFFNRLYNDALVNQFYYGTLCRDLNKYRQKPWNRRCATLKREYFNTPWSILSFIAALMILLFTFTQTLFTILSY
ncbi:hypothetical protein HHK36_029452 [Tetracentron sinense]|uniref:Uncharacterized protein n=1 Tax=Tetracentron sinense TaxID=13715 RepID=A0A835CZR6_TETSI|nr:hypothetical protein HHK36_029452 [Tetracentron sinense]